MFANCSKYACVLGRVIGNKTICSRPLQRQKGTILANLRVIVVLSLIFLLILTIPVSAQTSVDFDPESQFTITSVKPNTSGKSVEIQFSNTVNFQILKANLKIFPQVNINWQSDAYPNKIILNGKFIYGQRYIISMPENLEILNRTYVKTINSFTMPNMPPQLNFSEKKTVVERDSRQMIHVQIRNVDQLLFEGIKVPPIMLPVALAFVGQKDLSWDKTLRTLENVVAELENIIGKDVVYSNFLYKPKREKQLFYTTDEKDKVSAFSIPLNFREEKEKGAIELVRVSSNDFQNKVSTPIQIFRITDLGITYKISEQGLLVWVTSLKDGTPQKNVSILALDRKMGAFPLGKTDNDGILIYDRSERNGILLDTRTNFRAITRELEINDMAFLVVASNNDVSFIEVKSQGDVKPKGIYQVKEKGKSKHLLKGHVFTERGVYRPGEKVYFKGTVRKFSDGKIMPPEGGEITFEILSSKGEKIYTSNENISSFGTAAGEIVLKPFYPLGTYTLNMRFGPENNDKVSRTFQVQEFRPPRHFAEIAFKRIKQQDDSFVNFKHEIDLLQIGINGTYYAGGPLKHGKVRWKIYHSSSEYSVKDFETYSFGNPLGRKDELLESGESILDEKGYIKVEFPLDKEISSGKYGLLVIATVVDFDGRVASERKLYQADPDYLVGISLHPDNVQSDEEQELRLVVVNKKGERIEKGIIKAEIMELSYTYVRKRNEQGNLYWKHQEIWQRVFAGDLIIEKGTASFQISFTRGGRYLISFTYDDENKPYSSATLYHVLRDYYGYDSQQKEKLYEILPLNTEREFYKPGQTAEIFFNFHQPVSQFLVTLEQDRIVEHQVITPKKGAKSIKIPIKGEHAPNIYVSLLGIVPRGNFPIYSERYDDEAPTFVFGTLNLQVRKGLGMLNIGISEEVKKIKAEPGSQVTLDLSVKDNQEKGVEAEMAVGVVDESVLALTGYSTPTLGVLNHFDSPLGVFTGDLRTLLLHQTPFDLVQNEPFTGGGGLEADSEAITSKIRKDFNPVAYFNPSLITDANGQAQVQFTLPDTMTTYRVYVVACDKGDRFASSQKALLAVKEFYLEPGLPRFFTKGDRFRFFVSAFNTTDDSAPMDFSHTITGGLEFSTERPNYPLSAKDSTKVSVTGKATTPGEAKATFIGKFKDKDDGVQITIPINSGYVLGTEIIQGKVKGTADIRFPIPEKVVNAPWEEMGVDEVKCILTLSGSPFMRMTKGLRYLLRYPYGCVEQTSSGVLPLAALRGLIVDGMVPGINIQETDKFLKSGVDRLFTMQVANGGFGYWPGDRKAHPWGTIYATSALSVAKTGGYDIPVEHMQRAMEYLKKEVKGGKQDSSFNAFACYILALNGVYDGSTYKTASQNIQGQSREAKLLLLLAEYKSGLSGLSLVTTHNSDAASGYEISQRARTLLERRWDEKQDVYFYAHYREPAISLLVSSAIIPDDLLNDDNALRLINGIGKNGIWTSTSDTGWSLFALSEYFKGLNFAGEKVNITVSLENTPEQTVELDPISFQTVELEPRVFLNNPLVKLQTDNEQSFLYQIELTAPRLDYADAGYTNGFVVSKTIENSDGSSLIKVGDVVKVEVVVKVLNYRNNYIVIDDPLPAGLVAINSAFKTEEPIETEREDEYEYRYWTPEGYYRFVPNFFEIRDDRVLAFRDELWRGTYQYVYYARAVCEGEFVIPPTKVQLMYSPDIVGYTPTTSLIIEGRE